MKNLNFICLAGFFFWFCLYAQAQQPETKTNNILYISSYNVNYSWGDSVVAGILNTFREYPNYQLYFEYLDAKRFGEMNFKTQYQHLKAKYRNTSFDGVILSDNAAVNFMLEYGDSLVNDIPIAFCGINNPEDYNFKGTRFYGIKEGVDQDSVIQLILRVMPEIREIYFIADHTTTSLVNLSYIRKLEPKYQDQVQFVYYTQVSIDSLYKLAPTLPPGNAIALFDIFQDADRQPINSDMVLQEFTKRSSVPVFMDSETSFGKGIIGGILNSGSAHGADVARLAVKLIEQPGYVPEIRVQDPPDHYYFDYQVARQYGIDPHLFPEQSIIINQPERLFNKYLRYVITTAVIIFLLLAVITLLSVNNNRRKIAERLARQKLLEIEEKNQSLQQANRQVIEVNNKLEEINRIVSRTNQALEEARKKADESNRLKSAFLANMSHEIRTPLNAIVGFSSILNEARDGQELQRFTKMITNNSQQLLALIDDILDISKVETGELIINNETCNVHSIIFDVLNSLEQSYTKPGVELVFKATESSPLLIKTDPVRLRQVFTNLVSNALKFTEEGKIIVSYQVADTNDLVFSVADTGIGIDAAYHQKIFERFWKVEEGARKFYRGTGLGLAITKRLVEAMGGRIWVDSASGEGATFYFSLPKQREKTAPGYNTNHETILADETLPGGLRIAIAEDNENNLEFLMKVLQRYNPKLITFKNGQEIVDYFFANPEPVNIILMDLKMPRLTGYDASALIKSKFPFIPIIAQTAYAMKEDLQKIKQHAIDDVLIKPIVPDKLIKMINKHLNTLVGMG